MTDEIKFSYNWNNKLNCKCFSTIRVKSSKYQVGKTFKILLKNQYLFDATVKSLQYRNLNSFEEAECYLDTGYSKRETQEIIRKMYKDKADHLAYMVIILENCNKFEPETVQTKLVKKEGENK